MATVRYFAAAAEAAGTESEQVNAENLNLGVLLDRLSDLHGSELARVLQRSSVLHEGQYVSDRSLPIAPDAVLDVLPPFAGG